jgi:hypothetical protein
VRVLRIYPTYSTSIEKFTYISALGGTKVSWTRVPDSRRTLKKYFPVISA